MKKIQIYVHKVHATLKYIQINICTLKCEYRNYFIRMCTVHYIRTSTCERSFRFSIFHSVIMKHNNKNHKCCMYHILGKWKMKILLTGTHAKRIIIYSFIGDDVGQTFTKWFIIQTTFYMYFFLYTFIALILSYNKSITMNYNKNNNKVNVCLQCFEQLNFCYESNKPM